MSPSIDAGIGTRPLRTESGREASSSGEQLANPWTKMFNCAPILRSHHSIASHSYFDLNLSGLFAGKWFRPPI